MTPWLLLLMAVNWPQFRGPNAAGAANESGLPVEFGPGRNLVWRTELPRGASSPVLAGDRIYLTGADGAERFVFALNRASGKVIWRRSIQADRAEALHKLNDPASSSPATDGRSVYVFFGDLGLVAFDADGKERWRKPLGPFTNLHGMAASPILADGQLIMVCDQNLESFLLALDPRDGKTLWKTERPEVTHGFSTPALWRPKDGEAEIIVPGSYMLAGYSVATGKKLWWARGLTWQVKSAPVMGDGVVYFNGWAPGGDAGEQYDLPEFEQALKECDKNGDGRFSQDELPKPYQPTGTWQAIDLDRDGFLNARDWMFFRARRGAQNTTTAVRLGGRGDVTATHVLWRYRKSLPDVPTPLLYRDALFLVKTGGIATTLDPRTGEVLKQARLTGALDGYYSSPVASDGKVYIASEEGKVNVLKASGEWEVLAVNDLKEPIYSTPAIADGRIYVRTRMALYAFGQ